MSNFFSFVKSRYVILTLVVAAVLRLVYVFTLEERYYYFDTAHYDSAACSILENGTFGKSLHYYDEYEKYCLEPVYPIFLAGIYKVFGHSFLAVRIIQSFLSVLQLYFIFLIVRLFRPNAGKWALLFGAFYPFFIYISGLMYVTQLFALFLTLAVYAFLRYKEKYFAGWLVLSAFSLGIAIAARPVALPMGFLFALWILFFADTTLYKKIGHVFLAACCVILVLTPWTVRNWNVYHVLSPGRTCLAETRVFETVDLEFRIEDSKKLTTFPVERFRVHIDTTKAMPIFECFAGDKLVAKLQVNESFDLSDSFYCGVIFKGGTPMSIERIDFGTDNQIIFDSQSRVARHASPEIQFENDGIQLKSSKDSWQYLAVFDSLTCSNTFVMHYPNSIKPQDVSRVAILFNLDKPSLDANGYMVWLHPWMQADFWRVEQGRPKQPVKNIDLFIKEHPIDVKKLVMANPVRFLTKHVFPEFLNFWSPSIKRVTTSANVGGAMNMMSLLVFTPLLLFFVVGTLLLLKEWKNLLILFIPIVTISGVYSIFFTELRYRIPIDGLLIVLAAVGVDRFLHFILKKQ